MGMSQPQDLAHPLLVGGGAFARGGVVDVNEVWHKNLGFLPAGEPFVTGGFG